MCLLQVWFTAFVVLTTGAADARYHDLQMRNVEPELKQSAMKIDGSIKKENNWIRITRDIKIPKNFDVENPAVVQKEVSTKKIYNIYNISN